MQAEILTMQTDQQYTKSAVGLLTRAASEAIDARGFAIIGLSGGSTPKPIYEAFGKENIDWSKVWLFLVDDRYIRADDPDSNQFLLRSTLLRNAAIPDSQLIFPDTSLPLDECVALYEQHIASLLQKGSPDIITLGMGDDGHIASLFPPLMEQSFGEETVIHTTTEKFAVKDRISVTMRVLTRARQSVFFLKGPAKKKVMDEMIASGDDERRWPAKALLEKTGTTVIGQW